LCHFAATASIPLDRNVVHVFPMKQIMVNIGMTSQEELYSISQSQSPERT